MFVRPGYIFVILHHPAVTAQHLCNFKWTVNKNDKSNLSKKMWTRLRSIFNKLSWNFNGNNALKQKTVRLSKTYRVAIKSGNIDNTVFFFTDWRCPWRKTKLCIFAYVSRLYGHPVFRKCSSVQCWKTDFYMQTLINGNHRERNFAAFVSLITKLLFFLTSGRRRLWKGCRTPRRCFRSVKISIAI
jgi:hypothetical protein